MNSLPLWISAFMASLMGLALLLLWHINRQDRHVLLWGLSAFVMGLGLLLGPVAAGVFRPGWPQALQAFGASSLLMAYQLLQIRGALAYAGRDRAGRPWFKGWALLVILLASLGSLKLSWAMHVGAWILTIGCASSAALMWRHGQGLARWCALAFAAMGAVHLTAPWLHPLSQSTVTHIIGLLVQTILSLGLILLSASRAYHQVQQQVQRFSRLTEDSLQAVVVLRQHEVLYANPRALTLFGVASLSEAQQLDALSLAGEPDQREAARQRHAKVLASPGAHIEWEAPRHTADGRVLQIHGLSSHLSWDGQPAELLVMLDDTARHKTLQALQYQATHDELTGLPNRAFAVAQLEQLCQRARPFTLVSLDLDRFQLINEALGHQAGDELLRDVGQRLVAELPVQSLLCRSGEDQYLLLQEPGGDVTVTQPLIDQLMQSMGRPFALSGHTISVHVSAGVALYPQDGADAAALLRAADSAMHRAKAVPGHAALFFDPDMNRVARARMLAEQTLAQALRNREFHLVYQPKLRAGSRALCGFEALARWTRLDGSQVSPMEFITAAERTGQIQSLGAQILEMALDCLRDWQNEGLTLVPVAVNVSPVQLLDSSFAERLLAGLHEAGIAPALLQIEITETAAIGQLDQVLPQLLRLREAGVMCALDDFGTGQSSLTMLRSLPIHAMKLDRSMVEPLPAPEAAAVLRATCALGHSLHLEVVAEGVETEDQALALEALGCTQLQGYHLSRPLPAEQARQWLLPEPLALAAQG